MHQSFASTAPTYWDNGGGGGGGGGGETGLMCSIITFWMSPQCSVSAGIVISNQAHDRVDLKCSQFMQCRPGAKYFEKYSNTLQLLWLINDYNYITITGPVEM